ncbi:MAG TPA: rod shape-determining protein MreC [bacterium]|nr:rod shape-determining protein MreC [bacterium]HPN44882.1 rod shape-determining protein MreC [bacterium]
MSNRIKKIPWGDFFVLAMTIIASLIILISAHQSGQESALYTFTLNILGKVLSPVAELRQVHDLRTENQRLHEENIRLLYDNSQLQNVEIENKRLLALLDLQQYLPGDNVAARVTGFEGAGGIKAVILDAGRDKGIAENMPFIASAGLAGKIIRVAGSYSIGQLLVDKNFRAAARLTESRYTGIFEGTGEEKPIMWGVPQTVHVKTGEQIITAGTSSFFPEGIVIGHVTGIRRDPNRLFHILVIKPQVDYSRLEHVLILKSKEEQQ